MPSSALSASPSKTSSASSGARARLVTYQPFGSARDIFTDRAPELLLAGPAGTGKSLACLYKLHALALKYPRMRGAIIRKTRASLTQSALVTFDHKVQPERWGVRFHHGDQEYQYPNGSVIVVGGLVPDITKVMSTEYDIAYVQEATEIEEPEWESLSTRLRNGMMPYQQLLADCNPAAPSHWLKRRADAGRTAMRPSHHEDNPTLWDAARGVWTDFGERYIAVLDALTGVRKLRLRHGIWAAAEGMVYQDVWDASVHIIDRRQVAGLTSDGEIPPLWPRDWSIDFGYVNPFVWQCWVEEPDGELLLEREIYMTQRLVEDHAKQIVEVTRGTPMARPRRVFCDHDAEDRFTFERHAGVVTEPAYKAVRAGIQLVAARLRGTPPGHPRLRFLRDALVERDPKLDAAKRPACTVEEVEGYVWDTSQGRKQGEEPVKRDDHGLDATRYRVASTDRTAAGAESAVYDRYGRRVM